MLELEASPIRFRGAGGVAIAGDRWGPAGDRTVLLLHGGGQTRHAWGGTARALAAAGSCAITLDARGHGDSGWAPDGDYRLEAFSRPSSTTCSRSRSSSASSRSSSGRRSAA
jgi:alpha-beta hydrolase superfamily lysophospholipase